MEDKRKKKRDEDTGSEAHYKPFGLHFLQDFRASQDIKQETENITTSFYYTNTFNKIPSFCQFRFDGVYKRIGNTIKLSSRLVLKIQERKYETKNKPKEYLNLYTVRNGKLQYTCYISSLFRIDENTYWFDYWFEGKKIYYTLKLTDTTAIIKGSLFTFSY